MSRAEDIIRIRHMHDAGQRILRIVNGVDQTEFANNEEKYLSVTRLLEVIGEAARQVTDETRKEFPKIPWAQLAGTRNRLIHAYFNVDLDVLWEISQSDVPRLVADLDILLSNEK